MLVQGVHGQIHPLDLKLRRTISNWMANICETPPFSIGAVNLWRFEETIIEKRLFKESISVIHNSFSFKIGYKIYMNYIVLSFFLIFLRMMSSFRCKVLTN